MSGEQRTSREHRTSGESFDKDYWDDRWRSGEQSTAAPPNPYLVDEVGDLPPGTALEAGCGAGNEAIWLASAGWQVVAADISATALDAAAQKADAQGVAERIDWIEADLTQWRPEERFDLVTTHYAHPTMPQLDFYERIGEWVKPGGTLLIVGHLHDHARRDGHAHLHDHAGQDGHARPHGHAHPQGHAHGEGHAHEPAPGGPADNGPQPPEEVTATAESITALLPPTRWQIITAIEAARQVAAPDGRAVQLRDVVVRAERR